MILHDTYALHRKWWDRDWKPENGDTDWTQWDYILADVFQLIDDFTDKNNGQWMPDDLDGDVTWIVKKKYSGHDAVIDIERERNRLKAGESYYAIPEYDPDKPKPTLDSMIEALEKDRADGRPSHLANARPPTAEELRNLRPKNLTDILVVK